MPASTQRKKKPSIERRQQERLYYLLVEKQRRKALSRIQDTFDIMYPWQRELCAATKTYHESCLCAANQIGKTMTGTMIDAAHLTGDYPEGWEGHQFDFGPLCWGLGVTMEKTRDLLQTALFGTFNGEFSGGLVPKDRIQSWESAGGTVNAMRTVRVTHKSGGVSTQQFWSYSQGQHALMGDIVDHFHVDEEPKDQTIRPQLITRTINGDKGRGGRGIYTFTPENGRTELVVQFMDNASPSQFFMQKGWVDAPHITPEKAERLLEIYPVYQRDMRSKGTPMLGHGLIYEVAESFIVCEPVAVQDQWFVINGMDFGWNHPQAHIQLVEDRDNGIFYVTHGWKQAEVSANDAWGAVKSWNEHIPCAWPHDGLQAEKGREDSTQLRNHYRGAGFNMLHEHATWVDGGYSVETGLYEINNLMRKGLFKISSSLIEVLLEISMYHRRQKQGANEQEKIGTVVKAHDDLLDAIRYAYMMRRYAIRVGDINKPSKPLTFKGWQ